MARRNRDAPIVLAASHDLTAGLIVGLRCPVGKGQAFLRDSKSPGLRVRVTSAGAKSFVFEGKLNRQTIRQTIGDVRSWAIDAARSESNRLRVLLDGGIDPRELERDKRVATQQKAAAAERAAVTVSDAWSVYLTERGPQWSDLHYRDHVRKASLGGDPATRGTRGQGVTQPGPLAALMPLTLAELDAATIEAWAAWESRTRPTSARLAWRLLKVFLSWCAEQPAYVPLLSDKNPAKTTRAREFLGKAAPKADVLQREQLAAWFARIGQIQNPVVAAALQVMLLTGARPGEVLDLRWDDVNTKWKGMTCRRRSNIDPPCRSNIDPGMDADRMTVGCG